MRKQDPELQPQQLWEGQIVQTNLISFCAGLTCQCGQGKAIVVIYLDFSWSFDSDFTLHDILINKSRRYRLAPRLYSKRDQTERKEIRGFPLCSIWLISFLVAIEESTNLCFFIQEDC